MTLSNRDYNRLVGDNYIARNLIGESACFKETVAQIRDIAPYDIGVYIYGETGTGKELATRAIHYLSPRRDKPFISTTCGAFSDDLLLSELYGHAKGAFTGAHESRAGLVEAADGGTLFLDEIDSLSPKAQVALLRFLQEKEIKALGSTRTKKVDTRVICASNRDLAKLADAGKFRRDLLYRIDVIRIALPPLRARVGDIRILANHFLAKISLNHGLDVKELPDDFLREMESYSWPGNIRELENRIHKFCLLPGREKVKGVRGRKEEGRDPELSREYVGSFNEEKSKIIDQFEKGYLHFVLSRSQGNISEAAAMARKERRTFTRLLKKHGLERSAYTRSMSRPRI